MRRYLPFLLLFCLQTAVAQDPSKASLRPCGAPPGISPLLEQYNSHAGAFLGERSEDSLLVGMQLHLLAKDNGTSRISTERLLDAYCRLNSDFSGTGIRFYPKFDWNQIDSSAWFQHQEITQGIDMMLANNVPDVLNVYFASNVADNCGYNLPYAGVAISHSCAGADDHTWAHEVGHALSLPHPFIGWEGKVYSSTVPTPDTLTYDYTYFHDTLDLGPAPLDTALVEYRDGSNCAIAADRVCDTPADYLSYRWECDDANESLVLQSDPSGATFRSDGTLFMSYAADACQNRFSPEQVAIMRFTLQTEKLAWLSDETPPADLAGPTSLEFPVGGQYVPPVGNVLEWSAVPGATHYLVQVSLIQSFFAKVVDVVVTDTSFLAPDFLTNRKYYWRVRPFNRWYSCVGFTASGIFNTTGSVATTEADAEGWRCYPSLLAPGQSITLEMPASWSKQAVQYTIFDAAGRRVWQQNGAANQQKVTLSPNSENWPAGVYRLLAYGEKGLKTQTLMIGGR